MHRLQDVTDMFSRCEHFSVATMSDLSSDIVVQGMLSICFLLDVWCEKQDGTKATVGTASVLQ